MQVPVADLDRLFDTFLAVQGSINANLEAHASSLGLNSSQLLVIRDVSDHPGTSLKDLCLRCGLKKSAASRLIDGLIDRQMIVRKTCPTSRRAVALLVGPALGEGDFCRVTALTAALPGWTKATGEDDLGSLTGMLKTLLSLTLTPSPESQKR